MSKPRTANVRFRDWPWRARLVEKLYRLTHGGRVRTLVVPDEDTFGHWRQGRR